MGIRLTLNQAVRDNYAFVDPQAPVSLSLQKPRGQSPRLTNSIIRGLRAGTIIDVDGVVDINKGAMKELVKKEAKAEVKTQKKAETKKPEESSVKEKEVKKEAAKEEKAVKKEVEEKKPTSKKTKDAKGKSKDSKKKDK